MALATSFPCRQAGHLLIEIIARCTAGSRKQEIILAKVDGTFLRTQLEEGTLFEVRLGVLTTGQALKSRTAKHRSYPLLEHVSHGGIETPRASASSYPVPGWYSLLGKPVWA